MKIGATTSWILSALMGWLFAGCAGGIGIDEVEQAATACPGHPPPPEVCERTFCNVADRSWDSAPSPAGTRCGSNAFCDGDGNCVVPPPPPPPPTAPTNVQIVASTSHSISLAWGASTGADHYQVTSPSGPGGTFTTTTASIGSLTPGVPYCFIVTAVNRGGTASAPQVCGRTPVDVALAPWGSAQNLPPYRGMTPEVIGGLLDSLELRGDINDARLTGIIMLPPNGLASDCSRPGAIFMSVGGTLSGAALTQLYGSPRPPMDAGIPLFGCATFTTGNEEFVQVFVTAHY